MARRGAVARVLPILCSVALAACGSGGGSGGGPGGPSGPTGPTGPGTGPSGGDVSGCSIFPADNAWNRDISGLPVHANSAQYINSIGASTPLHPDFGTVWDGAPNGIPYTVVSGSQPKVPIDFVAWPEESDPGPYPIPASAPIEGVPQGTVPPSGDEYGDQHVLVVDKDNCILYELGAAAPVNGGASWNANCGAKWDLKTNATRPAGWTSADAAGLPIFPGLVRYDEVVGKGEIRHALRFTVDRSQRAYIAPASHCASSNTSSSLPPMGLRVRLKSGTNCSGYSREVQVICAALKKYGMIVADNGSNWYVSGAPDPRWSDDHLADLAGLKGSDFEAVDTGAITTCSD